MAVPGPSEGHAHPPQRAVILPLRAAARSSSPNARPAAPAKLAFLLSIAAMNWGGVILSESDHQR
jgi:hypothetical protein